MISAARRCPESAELAAFFESGVPEERAWEIRDHIDDCEECLGSLVSLLRGSRLGGTVETASELLEIKAGTRVGHFELGALLGAGNLGRVYSASDTRLGREVAVKVLGTRRDHIGFAERLAAEAQTMARIRHRNVCTVYDVGRDGELVYIAMEKIEGTTLRDAAIDRPGELVSALVDAASGLEAAHRKAVIHRDFKPDNIMVETRHGERRVVVCDFGLATAGAVALEATDETARAETVSGLVGSPAYMAPEQLDGAPVTASVDIWAFGVTAYELLVGERPFQAQTLDALRDAQRQRPSWPPGSRVDAGTQAVILDCLSEEPQARPRSMAEVIARLRSARRPRSRAPGLRSAVAVLAAVASVAAVAALFFGSRGGAGDEGSKRALACASLASNGWPIDKRDWRARGAAARIPAWLVAEVGERIDSRGAAWRAQQQTFCDADADPIAPTLWAQCREAIDIKTAAYLDALVSSTVSSFESVISAFDGLPPPSFCATREGLRSGVSNPTPETQRVRHELATAELLERAGAARSEWESRLDAAASAARSIDDAQLAAEVAFTNALLRAADSTPKRDAQWREVVGLAESGGNERLAAQAWLELADLWTDTEPTDRRATLALEQADWAIKRIGDPPRLRSGWHRAFASHAWKSGDYEGAKTHFSAAIESANGDRLAQRSARISIAKLATIAEDHARARALYEEVLADERTIGSAKTDRAALHSAYAEVLYQMGETDAGLAAIDEALRLAHEALEPGDPQIGTYRLVRAMLELEKGDVEASMTSIAAALALLGPHYGDRHSTIGAALNLRAAVEAQQGDHLAAAETSRQAHRLFVDLYGEAHESAIFAAMQLAENLSASDKLDESRATFEKTLAIARQAMGESHSFVTHIQYSLAGVLDRQGNEAEATALGEKALAAVLASQEAPPYIGQAEHQLADILADSNPTRALALARSAVARYADDPYWGAEREQAEGLIATLGRRR